MAQMLEYFYATLQNKQYEKVRVKVEWGDE
jgi:hypothetical protein